MRDSISSYMHIINNSTVFTPQDICSNDNKVFGQLINPVRRFCFIFITLYALPEALRLSFRAAVAEVFKSTSVRHRAASFLPRCK